MIEEITLLRYTKYIKESKAPGIQLLIEKYTPGAIGIMITIILITCSTCIPILQM